jgi:N6-adenosine-specific RNA methylase IME4
MIAGRLAEADSRYRANLQMPSRAEAANIMNVGSRSVASAKKVLADGVDELIDAVDRGEVAVSVAAKIADLPKEDQHHVIKADKPEVEIKNVVRQKKEKDLAVKTIEESVNNNTQLYNVILAEIPVLPWEKIASMKIPAADDCILFMWATSASLPEFLNVMKQWGFEYKLHIVWVKQKPTIGYWAKSWHELLLVGAKGAILPPPPELQPPSVIQAPAGRFSEKPAIFVETIEKLYPNALKLEIFSRSPREGWSAMGNEIGD